MISSTLVLIIGAIFALYYYFVKRDKRMSKFPPGPMGLPIIGNAHQIGAEPTYLFSKWAEKYGPTIGVKMGPNRSVILNDPKMIRELLNNQAFTGRANHELFDLVSGGNYGVLNASGPTWESQRRYTLRHLRDFGFGKNTMELLILEEVGEIIDWMKKEEGHPVSLNRKFGLAVLNSLWVILSGKRYEQDDNTLNTLLDEMNKEFNRAFTNPFLLFAPSLSKYLPNLTGYNKVVSAIENMLSFFKETIEEHESRNDGEASDFMAFYKKEIEKTTDPNSTFYKTEGDKNLLAIVGDLFQAGADTTSNTLAWLILYLVREEKQEIQRKLHEEIDDVIGKSRNPTLSDRPNMPYTEAVINEVLRYSSIFPIGVNHTAIYDIESHGYFFPKGTWLTQNVHGIHHSKEHWGDPENFRPERFIQNGKHISKPEAFLPFLGGKRGCIGEQLARDTIFLFTTSIFQRFNVCPDPSNAKPSIVAENGFIRAPKPFTVILKDRLEA